MIETSISTPKEVRTDINYVPFTRKVIQTKDWEPRYLGVPDEGTRTVTIHDARGDEDRFNLDVNGFTFLKLPDKERSIDNDEIIRSEYYLELEVVLKTLPRASKIHIFNHVIRRCSEISKKGQLDALGRWQVPPSGHPHVDYSGRPQDLTGTLEELKFTPPIHELFASARRFAMVNVWCPLVLVQRDPLAVADAVTVPESDYLVRERQFRSSGVRSGNYVLSHPNHPDAAERHAWYWLSDMKPDEIIVFKQLDSARDKPGWRCPHTAFVLPGTEDLPPRESIEVRAVCF